MDFNALLLLLRDTYRTGYLAGWCDGTGRRLEKAVTAEVESLLQSLAQDALSGRLPPDDPMRQHE